jgi:hypothetical protein
VLRDVLAVDPDNVGRRCQDGLHAIVEGVAADVA